MRALLFCLSLPVALVACADFGGFHLGVDPAGPLPPSGTSDEGGALPSPADGATPLPEAAPADDAGADTPEPPTGYAAIVLADGPVAYWRLDEPTGTTFQDRVAAHHGTLVGKATRATIGAVSDGNASITLDGATARIDVGDVFDFDGGRAFSVEAWVKAKTNANTMVIATKASPGNGAAGSATGWLFGLYGNMPTISFDGDYLDGPSALPVSRFSHVAMTYDGATVTLYVDGANVGSAPVSAPTKTPGQPLSLGAWSRGNANELALQGALDEVALYDKALAPARIAAHAAAKR